ncbi:MAG: glycosyltransferase family 2 protein [Gemmatimonadetes bacterium]|nr:glycosyltransferase family 2 protein [Gemmatimonadota bacterium]
MSTDGQLVSIVLPMYNAASYLPQTIESVISQTYARWELIVVDDHSTDRSLEIVNRYAGDDPRIRIVQMPANSGRPAVPRNAGLRGVRGDWVAFIDADDLWHPQKLDLQLGCLREHDGEFCFTDVAVFRNAQSIAALMARRFPASEMPCSVVGHAKLLWKNVIKSGSSVVLKRAVLDGRLFDERPEYKAIEDYLLWLELHQHRIKQSYWLRQKLVFYRLSASGISRGKTGMLRKNVRLYREYVSNGRPLGVRAYLYMASYVLLSVSRETRFFLTGVLRNVSAFLRWRSS